MQCLVSPQIVLVVAGLLPGCWDIGGEMAANIAEDMAERASAFAITQKCTTH
jgi:hypothetical protein